MISFLGRSGGRGGRAKGSFAEINSFPSAIAALSSRRVRTEGIITHRFGLGDYGEALEALRDDDSVHKIVIDPGL
jgi:D-arabinitol dehydrogenase (NADP+)